MAGRTLSSSSNALKAVEGAIMDITYGDDEFLKYLKAKTGDVRKIGGNGKKSDPYYYSRTVRTHVGDNSGAIEDGGTFNAYDPGTADLIKFPVVNMASTLSMSSMSREVGALVGSPGIDMESDEMDGMLADFALKMKQSVLGQAKGWVTTVKTGGSSTTIYVYDPDLMPIGTRWNLYGVSGDTWTKNTSVGVSGLLTVTDCNIKTGEITLSSNSSAITAGDYLVPYGQYGIRMNGLGDILNNNTNITVNDYVVRRALTSLGGLSRATYPGLKSRISVPADGAPYEITTAALFGFIAEMATAMGKKSGATTGFCHPFTLISIWNVIEKIKTARLGDSVKFGAGGEATIQFPLLKGQGTISGVIGYKKYCLDWFDFSDPEETAMRTVVEPHFIDHGGRDGIWKYEGKPGGVHQYSAVFDGIVGWPFNPRMCGEMAGLQLPTEYQIA